MDKFTIDYKTFTNCFRVDVLPDDFQDERMEEIANHCLKYGFKNVMLFFNNEEFNVGHITKEELKPWIETIKKAKQFFIEKGLSVSLNPWMELGHLDRKRPLKAGQNFTTMVDMNGYECSLVACPWDEEWRRYYFDLLEYYLKEVDPEVVWIEDDFRLHNHIPMEFGGCFCKLHMQKYNEKLGKRYTREEFVKKVFEKGELNPERKVWLDVNRESILNLAEKVGERIKNLGLKTRVGLMTSAPQSHCMEARDWKLFHEYLCAGQEKINRIHLPCYDEITGKNYGILFDSVSMAIRTFIPDDTYIYPELENGSFSNFTKDARFLRFQLESSLPILPSGMTYDIYDFVGHCVDEKIGYGEEIKYITPYMQGVLDLGLKFTDLTGVIVPIDQNATYNRVVKSHWSDLYPDDFMAGAYLGSMGVNWKFSKEKEFANETVFLAYGAANNFTDEQLIKIFANNFVIVDGNTVMNLKRRGLLHLIQAKNAQIYEKCSAHQTYEQPVEGFLVDGKRRFRASCLEKCGHFTKVDYDGEVRVYSETCVAEREKFGFGCVSGKGFLVIPYLFEGVLLDMFHPLRREILFTEIYKHAAPIVTTDLFAVRPYLYKYGENHALILVNGTVGSLSEIRLGVRGLVFDQIDFVNRDGKREKVTFVRDGENIVVHLPLDYLSTATLIFYK